MRHRDELASFFGWVLAASLIVSGLSYLTGVEGLAILAVLSPSVVAVVLTARRGLPLASLAGRRVGWRPTGLALITFPSLALIAAATFALAGDDLFQRSELGDPLSTLAVVVVIAIGEEFGWRGFALPRLLQRMNPWQASLILGVIWWLWHAPAAVLVGVGSPAGVPFIAFAPFVIGASALFTGFHLRWPATSVAIALHVGVNLGNGLTPVLPESIGGATGPFWLFTALVAGAGVAALARHSIAAR